MSIPGLALSALLLQLPASVEGIVVRAGTNTPIEGATVELTGIAPRTVAGSLISAPGTISVSVQETGTDGRVLSFTATTGRDGRFMIRNVPPTAGYQLIAIRQPDYVPAQYGQRIPAVPGRSITLTDGQQMRDLRIEMTPSGSISGRVVDAAGQPVDDAFVELRRPWYLEGWRLIADWQETLSRVRGVGLMNRAGGVETNDRGEFRFSGLPPAHYYVRISATNDATATRVDLHAGENVSNIRIVSPQLAFRHVRGTVVWSGTGAIVPSATVSLARRGVTPLYQNVGGASALVRNGTFDVLIREAGDYFLLATDGNSRSLAHGRMAIKIGDSDVNNVRLEIAPAFNISGSVVTEGGTGNVPMALSLVPISAMTPRVEPAELRLPEGTFTLRGVVPGDFRVEIVPILKVPPSPLVPSTLQNAYVKSIQLGRTDVLNGGLHLEASIDTPLRVVISTQGGTLEGRAVDDSGKIAINAKVVLVPDTGRRQRGDLYRSAASDDAGRYQLRGLAPGDYKLFAWERVEDGAWQDPDFMKLYENRGRPVRISEDGRITADAVLIPAWN
jgi:hypothetical protein